MFDICANKWKNEEKKCRPFTRGGTTNLSVVQKNNLKIFSFAVRVFPNQHCRTVVQYLHGWNSLLTMSKSKLKSWAKREWLPHKLVSLPDFNIFFVEILIFVFFIFFRYHSPWLPWSCSSPFCQRKQDSSDHESCWFETRHPRGFVFPHQESCFHPQAFGTQP